MEDKEGRWAQSLPAFLITKGKEFMKITQEQLITKLRDKTGYFKKYTHGVLNGIGDLLPELLAQATEDEDVEIFICPGVKLIARYTKPRTLKDPRNGEQIEVDTRILLTAQFTRKFKKDVNDIFNGVAPAEDVEEIIYGEDLDEEIE